MSERVYRTAIYARLSRDDGDRAESNSIASQRAMCEEYIANHDDLELVDTFIDMYNQRLIQCPAHGSVEKCLK